MTNSGHSVLYTGVTNDLMRRVYEHRSGKANTFTGKYKIRKLVWYLDVESILNAIEEEKRIKAGSRAKKIALIEALNPKWEELLPER
jgi:putative endonuclease